jgi:hypothetical protein
MTALQTQLGNLFYSIASADNDISPDQLKQLQKIVNDKWRWCNNQQNCKHPADSHIASILFDSIVQNMADESDNYQRFVNYYNQNGEDFTPEIKETIIKTACAVAVLFPGINKSAITMLGKISLLFKTESVLVTCL